MFGTGQSIEASNSSSLQLPGKPVADGVFMALILA
jgi:hypothetical protein